MTPAKRSWPSTACRRGFDWAVAPEAKLVVGDIADQALVSGLIAEHGIDSIVHFAGSVVVPDSVSDPLGYYENNTCKSRSLIETAIKGGVKHFIFSSTAAVYGAAGLEPVREDARTAPESPYGLSKLMTEWMLRDAAAAHDFTYTALRYFNVAGADPKGRTGRRRGARPISSRSPARPRSARRRHVRLRHGLRHAGRHCMRDYIHVSDLAAAHRLALARLRAGGASMVAIAAMVTAIRCSTSSTACAASAARLHGLDGAAPAGDPPASSQTLRARVRSSAGYRSATISTPSSAMR